MKFRRHHNNNGLRQIKRGKTREQVKRIAVRLGLPSYATCMSPKGAETNYGQLSKRGGAKPNPID